MGGIGSAAAMPHTKHSQSNTHIAHQWRPYFHCRLRMPFSWWVWTTTPQQARRSTPYRRSRPCVQTSRTLNPTHTLHTNGVFTFTTHELWIHSLTPGDA